MSTEADTRDSPPKRRSLSTSDDLKSALAEKLAQRQSEFRKTTGELGRLNRIEGFGGGFNRDGGGGGRFGNRLGPKIGGVTSRDRLGPPRLSNGDGEGRPKVVDKSIEEHDDNEDAENGERNGRRHTKDEDEDVDDGEIVDDGRKKSIIVSKSRDAALEEKKKDKKEVSRSKRMFGNLLGTLQAFRQDETKDKDRIEKKREIEKKIEEKTEAEREAARNAKKNLFMDKRRQGREIRILQLQMERVESYEAWEKSKNSEIAMIRTKCDPKLFYLPVEHNKHTEKALEASAKIIEEEIKEAKVKYEEDMKLYEEYIQDETRDVRDLFPHEDHDDENGDGSHKPRSMLVNKMDNPPRLGRSPPRRRPRSRSPGDKRNGSPETNRGLKRPHHSDNLLPLKVTKNLDEPKSLIPENKAELQKIVIEIKADPKPQPTREEDQRPKEQVNGTSSVVERAEKRRQKEQNKDGDAASVKPPSSKKAKLAEEYEKLKNKKKEHKRKRKAAKDKKKKKSKNKKSSRRRRDSSSTSESESESEESSESESSSEEESESEESDRSSSSEESSYSDGSSSSDESNRGSRKRKSGGKKSSRKISSKKSKKSSGGRSSSSKKERSSRDKDRKSSSKNSDTKRDK